jgi:MOSC domain-containing protein YiiM
MPSVVSVSRSPTHSFSKPVVPNITLLAGVGVEGDAHAGATVRHRYSVRKDPTAPNLCQVHLLHQELFTELAERGIRIAPGEMGENITTRDIDLLSLPVGVRLHLGETAVVEITGLRDPCSLLNRLHPDLMKACRSRSSDGEVVRKAGVMGIVIAGGRITRGCGIGIESPAGEPKPMGPV